MILLCCCRRLMIKRPTIAACNGRFRRRKNSAIRTLVAETLVLAKTHGYVEKIESELEEELARDISDPPEDKILRWRRKGDTIFKSKHVLLTVVILCVLDCALTLGELTLDLYKVKATLAKTGELTKATHAFVSKMDELHPHLDHESPYDMFTVLLNSVFIWTDTSNNTHLAANTPPAVPCSNTTQDFNSYLVASGPRGQGGENESVAWTLPGFTSKNYVQDEHDLEVVGKIAHIFHYLSIAILLCILIETFLKAICAGPDFFRRKLEVFDATVVLLSFVVDVSFLLFLPDIDTNDFVFILSILLPWRVIRVVNSLVVTVKDHEHFRLKLVYKRKKKIQGNLRDTEAMLQKYMSQVTTLQRLCIVEGIEEWKVDNHLKNDELAQPVTPSKRKFKFKFDDSGMQGHNRGPRCSMPSLDLHGVRLPSNLHASRSRISLPAVANSIKNTISKTLPSRRSSLASIEVFGTKVFSNGDVRKKKVTSEDLGTMEEEDIGDLDNHDSALSSRATSESGDVFSRLSVSDSIGSDRIFTEALEENGDQRRDSIQTIDEKDERIKLARIKEEAKRRHSESNIDKKRPSLTGLTEGVIFTTQRGKTYTKPQCDAAFNSIELYSVNSNCKHDSGLYMNGNKENANKNAANVASEINEQLDDSVARTTFSDIEDTQSSGKPCDSIAPDINKDTLLLGNNTSTSDDGMMESAMITTKQDEANAKLQAEAPPNSVELHSVDVHDDKEYSHESNANIATDGSEQRNGSDLPFTSKCIDNTPISDKPTAAYDSKALDTDKKVQLSDKNTSSGGLGDVESDTTRNQNDKINTKPKHEASDNSLEPHSVSNNSKPDSSLDKNDNKEYTHETIATVTSESSEQNTGSVKAFSSEDIDDKLSSEKPSILCDSVTLNVEKDAQPSETVTKHSGPGPGAEETVVNMEGV